MTELPTAFDTTKPARVGPASGRGIADVQVHDQAAAAGSLPAADGLGELLAATQPRVRRQHDVAYEIRRRGCCDP